jgi:hypothetical protein
VWGCGGASHVVVTVEDWRDTRPQRGGCARGAILMVVWWLILGKPPHAAATDFAKFGPQKLSGGGSRGNQWRHVAS